jgi:adenylylsulfate kinase-like enzyme
MRRVLLTGMSATGKSTITAALAARGYRTVDLDTEAWSHWVDVVDDTAPGTPVEAGRDWVWRDDRVAQLLAGRAGILVISGCSPNQGKFYPQLDAVVLLLVYNGLQAVYQRVSLGKCRAAFCKMSRSASSSRTRRRSSTAVAVAVAVAGNGSGGSTACACIAD